MDFLGLLHWLPASLHLLTCTTLPSLLQYSTPDHTTLDVSRV